MSGASRCWNTLAVAVFFFCLALIVFSYYSTAENNTEPEILLLSPDNGSEAMNRIQLGWYGLDEEDDPITYDLYLDEDPYPVTLIEKGTSNSFHYPVGLIRNTTYYWRVIASDGNTTNESEVWSFHLINYPPEIVLMHPDDQFWSEETYVSLVWLAFDGDPEDNLTYHVYMDTDPTPSTRVNTTTDFVYFPPKCVKGTKYYWMVSATDGWTTIDSEIRSFTIANHAQDVSGLNSRYIRYYGNDQDVDPGGEGYGFRMYRNNTLKVSITVQGGNADFYLVRPSEVRVWQWGDENVTLDSIPTGTRLDTNHISYTFTAPEDGVYCVIVDDSDMGEAPCVDDPDTYYEETLTMTYSIELDNPVSYSPLDDDRNGDGLEDDDPSLMDSIIGGFVALACFAILIVIVVTVIKDEQGKRKVKYSGPVYLPPVPQAPDSVPFQQMSQQAPPPSPPHEGSAPPSFESFQDNVGFNTTASPPPTPTSPAQTLKHRIPPPPPPSSSSPGGTLNHRTPPPPPPPSSSPVRTSKFPAPPPPPTSHDPGHHSSHSPISEDSVPPPSSDESPLPLKAIAWDPNVPFDQQASPSRSEVHVPTDGLHRTVPPPLPAKDSGGSPPPPAYISGRSPTPIEDLPEDPELDNMSSDN